jgi:hypothetical protein
MPRTTFLARLIGLFFVIAALSMLVRKGTSHEAIAGLIHNPSLLVVLELLGVLGGLAMVLGHNIWSGGFLPIVVTVIGWLVLLRNTVLLFLSLLSPDVTVNLFNTFRLEQFYYIYALISLVIGGYLLYASFRRPIR